MATTIQKETEVKTKPAGIAELEAPIDDVPAEKPNRRPLVFGVLGVLLVAAIVFIVRFVAWSAVHVSTDDATITSDVVQIAPQVTGTVIKVNVNDNQHVKKGDLLVELDPSSFQTAYLQAKANLDLAIAEAKGAQATVDLTKGNTEAQVMQATGVVGQSSGGIASSIANVAKARAAVSQARAQDSGASANVYGAQANIAIAKANKQKALDAVSGAQAQLDTSLAAVRTAQANVDAAKATADNAAKQAVRNETLFSQGAVSGQVAEQMRAAADVAKAEVNAAQQQLAQAQAVVAQRRSDLRSAKNQVPAAEAAISQAMAQLTSAREVELATSDTIKQTQAEVTAAEAAVNQALQRKKQAAGQLFQANTAPSQIAVSRSAQSQAEAKIELAQAALRDAQINLDRTKIYAPSDGRVSKSTVEVGNLVQPGGALMSIVPDEDVWVVANFKETQLADVKQNQPTDIEVDAFPGRVFKAHVDSISAGTGSTFALLPADNATGNFTKVVQRVPVKILLEHGQPGMEQLRDGMSVIATIETGPTAKR
jgi:membrane fusion protein (multidrug efflux system)